VQKKNLLNIYFVRLTFFLIKFEYIFCSLTQNIYIFYIFGNLRMRNLYEFIKIVNKFKDFNKVNRLIYSTKIIIFSYYCSIFK